MTFRLQPIPYTEKQYRTLWEQQIIDSLPATEEFLRALRAEVAEEKREERNAWQREARAKRKERINGKAHCEGAQRAAGEHVRWPWPELSDSR